MGQKFCCFYTSSWWIFGSRYLNQSNNCAFIGVSLISSATYVLNDLKDVNIDKLHPVKKNRPIALEGWKKTQSIFFSVTLILLSLFYF